MYGIQVNVGRVPAPDWRWIHGDDLERVAFQTESEAVAARDLWYPGVRSTCFRVAEFEEMQDEQD